MSNGVVVTIYVLLALIAVIMLLVASRLSRLERKISDAIVSGKPDANPSVTAAPAAAPRAAAPVAPASAYVEPGVPGEVVAVIMAAICAMGDGQYTLKAVRRGANNWGRAGMAEVTAPF